MNTGADSLPSEVLVEIFSYLSYEDLVKSVQFVCTWWQEVSWEKGLWKNIIYQPSGSSRHVMDMLKISPQLRALNLIHVTVNSNLIQLISDSCLNLEDLYVYWDSICDNAEVLMGRPMSQIKTLRLKWAKWLCMDFEFLDRMFPNLESLYIYDLNFKREDLMAYLKKKRDSLHTLSLCCYDNDNLCVLSCLTVCSKLRNVHLWRRCREAASSYGKDLEKYQNVLQLVLSSSYMTRDSLVLHCFPNIRELELHGVTVTSEDILRIIAHNCPQLQKLKLIRFSVLSSGRHLFLNDILKYGPYLERLAHLCIRHNGYLTDEGIEYLQLMPELKHLQLYNCELVTPVCIKLICGFSKLEVLKFDLRYNQLPADLKAGDVKNKNLQLLFYNCKNVSALDSLRQQYLRVSSSSSSSFPVVQL